jgi:hypothetical protein
MAKTKHTKKTRNTKHLDLSREKPGPRSDEVIEFGSEMSGLKVWLRAWTRHGTPQQWLVLALVATGVLTWSGCGCAATLWLIGLHGWDAASGLLLPLAICLSFIYGLRTGGSDSSFTKTSDNEDDGQ